MGSCICNHTLRHAYKIENLITQEISILGIDHFQQFEIYRKAKNNNKMLNYKNEVSNKEKLISFDELKYEDLISDLNNRNCTQSQVEMLFNLLKSNKNRLDKYNIDKNELQKAVNKQLGNLKNTELRKLLVETECLFGW